MAEKSVHYELSDKTAVIRLDDGKANAISPALIDSLHGMLDQAAKEATAVLVERRQVVVVEAGSLAELPVVGLQSFRRRWITDERVHPSPDLLHLLEVS